jgi:hypothetical protein
VTTATIETPTAIALSAERLSDKQIADEYGVRRQTLRVWRHRGIGPAYVKPEGTGRVFYLRTDVEAWLAGGRVEPVRKTRKTRTSIQNATPDPTPRRKRAI